MIKINISFGSNVRVVLTQNHEMTSKLGNKGDTVVVKAGYMRNCLSKKGLAVYATPYHRERKVSDNSDSSHNDSSSSGSSSTKDRSNEVA